MKITSTFFSYKSFALIFVLLSCLMQLQAQTIKVFKSNARYVDLTNGSNMAMPTAAKGASRDTIYIQNTGASTLNLTGTPLIQITGTNANDFTITVNPATTLGSGSSTYFVITYKPLTTSVSNAVLRILSNSTVNSNFTLNIKGGGTLLYGSLWPPVDGVPPFVSSNNVEAGRPGGRTTTYSQIALAAKTTTWWGPSVDSSGVLQLKLSLDGGTYARDEVFTYVPAESNLNLGKVVWRGVTRIQNAITNSIVTVYTRATLTVTNQDNSVKPLVDPLSIGLSEQVGGLVKIDSALQVFKANYFVEASLNGSTGWTPYLDFYDAYPTPPGPLPGQGVGAAYVTLSSGTYWVNNRPRLTNNQILTLDEGTSQVISTAFLNATDLEDMPAYPDSVVFVFRSNTSNNSPLVFQRGVLKRNNTVLNKTDSFTLKDTQNGLISYTHDGSETVYDEFQFSVKDSKKVLAQDGTATIFNFKINIAPVNDAPSTRDTSFNVSYLLSSTKNLVATDPDNANLSFSLVSQGTVGGTLNVQTNGQFTHTPPVGTLPGSSAVFTYRAFDGTSYSNTSSVTLNYMNLPPVTQPLSVRTLEDVAVNGNLSASDPEGSAVSYQLIKNGTKGSVILNANGSFSYQPALTKFGKDYFTYKAADALNNFSAEDTVWVHIIPRMDEGDVIVADKSRIHLFDPATGQDTLIANGGLLSQAQNIFYKKGTSVFVLDQAGGLIKFHPYTGNQTLILGAGSFNNNPGALGITMNNAGKLVIADGPNGIKQVDTLTGGITTLFSGGNIQFPTGVTYLSNGDLLVSDGGIFAGGTSKILRIQPNGTQTVVTSGNLVVLPVDLAVIDQNTIVVADGGSMAGNADRVYKVNLTTGVQTLITTGVNLNFPSGLDYYPKLDKLYVVNQNNAKLLDVNTATGNQTVLSGASSFLTQPFGLLVIGSPIYITSVNVPSNGTYIIGQTLSFQVNFSSAVTVTGSPTLQLTIGSATVNASYVSGSGTTTLTFQYVVQQNEVDTDGIAVNTLGLNGGTITGSGTDADITLNNVGNTANVLVDGIRPVVDSIKRYNPLTAITGASSVVFRVYFSENVKNIASTAFQLTATGVSGTISNVSSTTGNTVDVTVSGITGNGSLRLDVKNSGTGITDIPGNPLNGGFTSGEQYFINHAPAYTGLAIQTISICAGSAATAVNTLLQTSDIDNGQTLTWSIILGTLQGTVSGLPYSASANGGNIAPAGITYQPPANYSGIDSFKIRVSDGYESDTIEVKVTVIKANAGFSINSANQCVNENNYVFTNSSNVNSGSLTYSWNFGDGNTSTSTNPNHTYTTAGTYAVKLVVTSNNGCKDSVTQNVTVYPKPTVNFTIASSAQCLNGNSFSFTNGSSVSTGTISSQWSFGDGNTSTSANPTYTYTTAGTYTVKLVVTTNNGCKDSITKQITVHAKPSVSFTVNNSNQCVNGNSFSFTNGSSVSSGTISSQWSFGDGNTSTSANPTYTYTTAGIYTVKLVITSSNGCKDSVSQQVTVNPKPTAGFTTNSSAQCINPSNNFVFTNTSTITSGSITSAWSFGDGNTSTSANPNHTYTTAGTYAVKLVLTSNNGCKDSVTQNVTVYPKPVPDFTINGNTTQCLAGNSFSFNNATILSTGTFTSLWNFGDGKTATTLNATHVYTTAGTYTVKLIVTSSNGCKDSILKTVTVLAKPTVAFTVNDNTQCINGNQFVFTNNSSVSTGAFTSNWSFGDGGTASSANATYSYSASGNYTVKLVISSIANGCKDSISQVVSVFAKPTVGFTVNNAAQCLNGNNFSFTNTGTISSGTFTSAWNFGDGITAATKNAAHIYTASGIYPVKLVLTSNYGCKDSIISNITVHSKPVVSFTVNNNAQCINGNSFVFTNNSSVSAGAISSQWFFGNGANANTSNATYTYPTHGNYTVKLVVATDNACKDSTTQPVTVFAKPNPSFTVNDADQCLKGNSFSFSNKSNIATGSYTSAWSFGDGNGTGTTNAVYTYAAANNYTVKLVLTSNNGCKDSTAQTVNVYSHPVAGFDVNDAVQCLNNNSFAFTNTTTPSTGNTYKWSFGDGGSSSLSDPDYAYNKADTFTVWMYALSSNNCKSDTVKKTIVTVAHPVVKLGPDRTVLEGDSIILSPQSFSGIDLHFKWTPNSFLNNDTIPAPVANPQTDMNYRLTVTGQEGCTASDDIFVKLLKYPLIPNAFSPNGDGINDKWIISYLNDYPNATVEIFDRSGRIVFRASAGYNTSIAWDGRSDGKPLPVGTYYYIIEPKNGRARITGYITLLR